jgi:nucleoside-specific outer membrane channel protein Tsx
MPFARPFAVLAALTLTATPAFADDLIEWHGENVQVLRGWDYELGERERTIITLEHASRWRYGDVFAFVDFSFGDTTDTAYGEITPRLSLSRLSGQEMHWGPVSDVLLAATYERGKNGVERYLAGLAVDLDAPGFRFLRVHAFVRDDPSRAGQTWQTSLAWNRPFTIGGEAFVIEGFADFAGSEGSSAANQLISPRLLWDIGAHAGAPARLYFGVEWQYWRNKFGVDGVTESLPQVQLKWTLQ